MDTEYSRARDMWMRIETNFPFNAPRSSLPFQLTTRESSSPTSTSASSSPYPAKGFTGSGGVTGGCTSSTRTQPPVSVS